MKKFSTVIEKFSQEGVRTDNIEYAIDAVKEGITREHIIDSLTADYRGMSIGDATVLLNEIYAANGGEFKKENRGGYLYGTFMLLLGLGCGFYLWNFYTYGGVLLVPALVWGGATVGTLTGVALLVMAFMGKYRDEYRPFKSLDQ